MGHVIARERLDGRRIQPLRPFLCSAQSADDSCLHGTREMKCLHVASKASETHHSTELLKRRTNEIMEEVEIDLRTSSQNLQDDNEQHEVESITNNEIAKGFKRRGKKIGGGEPQKRWIGALEKGSRGQSSQHASHIRIESPQTFAQGMRGPIVENYDSSQGMTSMTQLLQVVFQMFDRKDDGQLTKKELSDSLENISIHIPNKDFVTMIDRIDANGDGLEDYRRMIKIDNHLY
ncbi:hypothetical protein QJS04_geneDACA017189 [Acorus gramineus]|uniref:EF-hand domain-containing protein n=1 Tax=Acorus gramineus TaxID=55184 RepID=A0AAV9BKB4_ACOGR|nr:hypothetical protein QJS04_geneDACA017189 [Acorus gramineus]